MTEEETKAKAYETVVAENRKLEAEIHKLKNGSDDSLSEIRDNLCYDYLGMDHDIDMRMIKSKAFKMGFDFGVSYLTRKLKGFLG